MSSTALLDQIRTLRPENSDPYSAEAEDEVAESLSGKGSLDIQLQPGNIASGSPHIRKTSTPQLRSTTSNSRLNRPNYHTGLSEEELKRPPKERLNALLGSNSSKSLSPVEITSYPPQTALLGTTYSKTSIVPPRDIKQSSEPVATRPPPVSSSSAPIFPGAMAARSLDPQLVRESSLDSTLSSMSSIISTPMGPHTPSTSVDLLVPTESEPVSSLIAASGSAEDAIKRLLKDKQNLTSKNEQLWKLVEKQRAMILGLNKDLDKLVKDRERYRKKLKDQLAAVDASTLATKQAEEKAQRWQHHGGASIDSTMSASVRPSDLSLRNPRAERDIDSSKVLEENTDDVEVDQAGQKRAIPAPLPLRTGHVRDGLGSPESLKSSRSYPASPDMVSPGGTKKKAPPTPLRLGQTRAAMAVQEQEQYSDGDERSPEYERGRRRTREDDDRAGMQYAEEEDRRSRSKKDKGSKSKGKTPVDNEAQNTTLQPARATEAPLALANSVGLPSSPRAPLLGGLQSPLQNANLGSIAGMMGSRDEPQMISMAALKSPGLPMSPRPGNRPAAGPAPRMPAPQFVAAPLMSPGPMSARGGLLSPRPPRQPIPLPPTSQFGSVNPHLARAEMYSSQQPSIAEQVGTMHKTTSSTDLGRSSGDLGPIYRGFVSADDPNVLLPPAKLRLVSVIMYSSRLRPSRHSMIGKQGGEEDQIFTLAVHARVDGQQLWRIEKTLPALNALDSNLRRSAGFSARLPDKSLFAGHAPIKIDQRRAALNEYFGTTLGSPLDENASRAMSAFLASDVIAPKIDQSSLSVSPGASPPTRKEGYLAKKGKSFGGWKARYFLLDGRDLQYFETPGGQHIGSIRLQKAQIAHQNAETSSEDSEYRHAFMILEQKRDDSLSLARHILCAESDQERDEWMIALRSYVEGIEDQSPAHESTSSRQNTPTLIRKPKPNTSTTSVQSRTPELQSVGYDQTITAGAPIMGSSTGSSASNSPVEPQTTIGTPSIQTNFDRPAISGPVAGGPIQNVYAWGNKAAPAKESKRNIFGFKSKGSEDAASGFRSGNGNQVAMRHSSGRAVFGMPLIEAAELFPPIGIDIYLPSPVYRCIEWMEAHEAAKEQGLFRQSGSQTGINNLKERFNKEGDVNLMEDGTLDAHTIASLCKMYFRELPESVLTRASHLDFLKVLEVRSVGEKLDGINVLVHRLPQANFELLSTIFRYLAEVVAHVDTNLMTVKNLATIWTAALSIPAPLIDHFITNHDAIFGDAVDEATSPIIQAIDSGSPTGTSPVSGPGMDELRSPRKQMFTDLATPMPTQTSFGPDVHAHSLNAPQPYEYASSSPRGPHNFRAVPVPAPSQQYYGVGAPGSDQGFSSLNAALAPSGFAASMGTSPSPQSQSRNDDQTKLQKKSRRESSIRHLGISSPLMSPGLGPSPGSSSSGNGVGGLMSPNIDGRRKSSMTRLKEMTGFKEES